jgi:hypothetical protein
MNAPDPRIHQAVDHVMAQLQPQIDAALRSAPGGAAPPGAGAAPAGAAASGIPPWVSAFLSNLLRTALQGLLANLVLTNTGGTPTGGTAPAGAAPAGAPQP